MAHNEIAQHSLRCWTSIDPATMPSPSGGWFSHAGRIDLAGTGLVFVSGQMPLDGDGNVVGVGDLRTQTERVFDNLSLILADQGATFDDVVNIRTFLTDMSQISEYGSARAKYLVGTPPTSTTVQVSRLVHPDAMVEIDIVAVVGSHKVPPNSRGGAS
jgi:enamine deaminase RidA (YjgF/YER057c/UK114 family)